MPAPRNDSSCVVSTFRAASSARCADSSCSESAGSRSSSRPSRTAAGMSRKSCSTEETPIVRSISSRSSSMRAQSCSRWYFRSSGYDSAAANSALPLVDRFPDDPRLARLAPHVDRQLVAGRCPAGGHVAHPDPDVEHRRVRAGGHLAAAVDRHALAWDSLLLHHEGDELSLRALLLDAPQLG